MTLIVSVPIHAIETIKSDLMNLKKNPKTIITQIGGNDLCEKETSVEKVSNDYATLVAETKTKFSKF